MKYENRPVVIPELFDKQTHEQIQKYVNDYVPLIPLVGDEAASSCDRFNRLAGHNISWFMQLHNQLVPFANELFGEVLKPSYVFYSSYRDDGRCPIHLDRPQCRYTIDYLIQQEMNDPWPIRISDQMSESKRAVLNNLSPIDNDEITYILESNTWTECLLNPNDAVCYSGTHAWHYRPTVSGGKADLVFFHFVPESFEGSLD